MRAPALPSDNVICVSNARTGMTETCTTVSFPQIEQRICTPGSAGRLIPGIVARVVKPDGSLAGLNEPGQLVVKGPAMALRYMNNDEACVGRPMFAYVLVRSPGLAVHGKRLSMGGFIRGTK